MRRDKLDRAQVLARAAAQMIVRDDEDLAVAQLPARPGPGRPDDRDLHATPELRADELAELGAERSAGPADRPAGAQRLAELRREREQLGAQRQALPLRELRALDAIAAERDRVRAQRDDAARRLEAVPAPERRAFGRTQDPHAAQRTRLTAAVSAADQQIAALDVQASRLERELGPAGEVRAERDGLERRIAELEREVRAVRDELAERQVADPPAWAREMFGARPEQYRRAEYYDRGVREVARYRIEHDVAGQTPGLGPEPASGAPRSAWRQADRVAEQTQRRLGRDVARDRERDVGLER
jgi:chemotaxis protein histidine kinase CheA